MSQIRESLLQILRGLSTDAAAPDQGSGNLLRDYGLDSLQSVALMSALEDRYGVVFGADPNDMDALQSLEHLTRWVADKQSFASP